jgi:hypothetical protein
MDDRGVNGSGTSFGLREADRKRVLADQPSSQGSQTPEVWAGRPTRRRLAWKTRRICRPIVATAPSIGRRGSLRSKAAACSRSSRGLRIRSVRLGNQTN